MSAEDKDSERYNGFEYKLQSTSATDLFRVDSKTGEITTRAALDREQRSLHRFNVVAYDRQAPTMSSSAVVSVQVLRSTKLKILSLDYRLDYKLFKVA